MRPDLILVHDKECGSWSEQFGASCWSTVLVSLDLQIHPQNKCRESCNELTDHLFRRIANCCGKKDAKRK